MRAGSASGGAARRGFKRSHKSERQHHEPIRPGPSQKSGGGAGRAIERSDYSCRCQIGKTNRQSRQSCQSDSPLSSPRARPTRRLCFCYLSCKVPLLLPCHACGGPAAAAAAAVACSDPSPKVPKVSRCHCPRCCCRRYHCTTCRKRNPRKSESQRLQPGIGWHSRARVDR